MRSVDVHLVRHGQSTWNVEGRLQGQTAHPQLTAQGRTDATRAAARLVDVVGRDDVAIVSSDLVRATQTALLIEAAFATAGTAVADGAAAFAESLREQHLGTLQGRLTSELRAQPVPEDRHISEVRWGGGESLADVHARLARYFEGVLQTAPRHLVVVTHGDTLRVARAVLTGRSHREVEWDVVPNGAVVTVRCGPQPAEVPP